MKTRRIGFLLVIFSCVFILNTSCKRDSNDQSDEITEINAVNFPSQKIPFACDLIKEKTMRGIIGLDFELEILDGNRNSKEGNSSSCFYKWDDKIYDSSGIFIQVQGNPLPAELPDFVQAFINNKKWEGENSREEPGVSFKYLDFTGLPVQAIYNRELARYYFAKDTEFLCSVAFNYPIDAEKMDAMFIEIANLMLKGV